MSFNVTQCPACESTFNTNSRVLAAAAGKVRCGACLNVFEAIDNFLISEEADATQTSNESVFVGNNPQEFFDPSSFLTRSALRESGATEPARADTIDEQDLHQELEQSAVVSEEFFTTVAEELQGKEEALQDQDTEFELTATEQKAIPTEQLLNSFDNRNIDDNSIDEDFEEEIVNSFIMQASESSELVASNVADSAFESEEEQEILAEPELDPATSEAEESQADHEESFINTGLSASFTFGPYDSPEVRIRETESASPTEKEQSGELLTDRIVKADAESEENTEAAETPRPPETPPQLEPEPTLTPEAEAIPEPIQEVSPSGEISPAETEATNSESTEDEVEADFALAEPTHDEAAPEAVLEDVQAAETSVLKTEEVDEESTETIRARALEAELSDEEALEAIPQENLAALGNMSTPVEFLARRESRVLRSTLLFLTILLLGSLLSAQYLYQHRERYSQLAQLRPLYEFTCSYLGCELPEYADINSIRSENLVVQSHPTFTNALMVNTIIRNTAAFEQAFPILILSFNSADNTVIALREFTSEEYLDPGLRFTRAMPAMTPVQIGLAIMDPGPGAVNYTLAFRWP